MNSGNHIARAGQASDQRSWALRRWWFIVWLGLWCGLGFATVAPAQTISKEYQLKAAFLYNFTKFVEWPTNRFAAADSPIIIGVLGVNPFADELAKAVAGRTQNGHGFLVTNFVSVEAAGTAHLLFVTRGHEPALQGRWAELHAAGVLTVGESAEFAAAAGVINFTTEADKIRFEINLETAELGGLKISSKLLQLAKTVRRKPTSPAAP